MKLSQTRQFRKDIKRLQKRGKDLAKLKAVIDQLITGQVLAPKHRDHPLSGGWVGHRDCHIEPDWILIYKILDHELRLERTGTHADLF
jgi:mRNA interferase YafQ